MEWQLIETAPKDGTQILLWSPSPFYDSGGRVEIGSFRVDEGFSGDDEPQWLDNSYDDFSCDYASCPIEPTHWMPLPSGPS